MSVIHKNVDKIIDASNNTIVISEVKSVVDAVNNDTYTKAEVDSAVQGVKNDLLNGAGAAYDTLGELATALTDNDSEIAALTTSIASKVSTQTLNLEGHLNASIELKNGVSEMNVSTTIDHDMASLYTKAEVDALIAAALPFTVDDSNSERTDIIF